MAETKRTLTIGDRTRTHGYADTRIYNVWKAMRRRCSSPRCGDFPNYGGRGIRVCDRWQQSFQCFLDDMGFPPSRKHSLDRYPNRDGNYEPGNCRWATSKEQTTNSRKPHLVTVGTRTMNLSEWAVELGTSTTRLHQRVNQGMTWEQACGTPVKKYRTRGLGWSPPNAQLGGT